MESNDATMMDAWRLVRSGVAAALAIAILGTASVRGLQQVQGQAPPPGGRPQTPPATAGPGTTVPGLAMLI